MKKTCLSIVCVLWASLSVHADTVLPPCSHVTFSSDRSFTFVMLAPKSEYECVGLSDPEAAERKALRTRFKSSGMYENGDPARLKWAATSDWFAYQILVTNDGEAIVRMGPWARNFSDEAFSFIRNGTLVRTVAIDELIENESSVKRSVSHFMWSDGFGLTSAGDRFFVNTLEGASYQFDVKTGETVSSTPPKTAAAPSPTSDGSNGTCSFTLIFLTAFAAFRTKAR